MSDPVASGAPAPVEDRPFGVSTAPARLDVLEPDEAGRAVLAELSAALPADRMLTDPDTVRPYVHDDAEWAEFGTPLVVVRARSTAEVAAVVTACARHRVPVVARGAGSGLSGGANAVDGCVLLCTEKMTEILEISRGERLAVVQPGVINDHLRAACAEQDLWYPPDPASAPWSTVGGNVATNAGGLCCVKYGV
ncbi:MAG: FAD-binding oxidoreductase, partial [Pseudonocardia sp.]|nr:FAD-binding oxidoreductase [Pseudonocardia sp.]